MNERELSKLAYLKRALAIAPELYEEILALARHKGLRPASTEFKQALESLREKYKKEVVK